MVTATIPAGSPWHVRAKAVFAVVLSTVTTVAGSAVKPHKAAIARLADIPLTVAGIGCVDFAGFHIAHGWGWLITGLYLVLLEHLIADDE